MFKLSYNHTSSNSLLPLSNGFVNDPVYPIRPQCVLIARGRP